MAGLAGEARIVVKLTRWAFAYAGAVTEFVLRFP